MPLALRDPPLDHRIEHELSRDRLFEGEPVTVTVRVSAGAPIALIELVGPRPASGEIVSGRHRTAMTVRSGETATWSYDIRFPVRGVHDLGTIAVRVSDRFGVRTWEHPPRGRESPCASIRASRRCRSCRRPLHARASVGDHVSAALGEGIEPGDIRPFAPGDRVRQVNWRASLRLGTLYVTQRHRERNADVVLMLDTLAEVGRAPRTTLDFGTRAAASLATAYLARKDRVGLITYGGLIHWVRPASGRTQYERIVEALARTTVVFTYVAKDLAVVPPRVLPSKAVVLAITPLLDRRFLAAALDLAGARLRPRRPRRLARRAHAADARAVADHRSRLPAVAAGAPGTARRAVPAGHPGARVGAIRSRSSWPSTARGGAARAWSPRDELAPGRRVRARARCRAR